MVGDGGRMSIDDRGGMAGPEAGEHEENGPVGDADRAFLLHEQIRRIAGALPSASRFPLRRMGHEIQVRLLGSILFLSVPVPEATPNGGVVYRGSPRPVVRARRPMEIGLSREDARDRARKEAGINREVSLGDAEFDREVFVHTHAPDDTVRAVLADEGLRGAILGLLREDPWYFMVDDDNGNLTVHFKAQDRSNDLQQADRILDGFALVISHFPAIEKTGDQSRRWNWIQSIGLVAAVCLPGSVLCFAQISESSTGADGVAASACWGPLVVGLIGGALVASPVRWIISRKVRGQFNSATKQRLAMIASTILLMQIVMLVAGRLW